jgi:hypothetical protein
MYPATTPAAVPEDHSTGCNLVAAFTKKLYKVNKNFCTFFYLRHRLSSNQHIRILDIRHRSKKISFGCQKSYRNGIK